jgi:hypothetical protein
VVFAKEATEPDPRRFVSVAGDGGGVIVHELLELCFGRLPGFLTRAVPTRAVFAREKPPSIDAEVRDNGSEDGYGRVRCFVQHDLAEISSRHA